MQKTKKTVEAKYDSANKHSNKHVVYRVMQLKAPFCVFWWFKAPFWCFKVPFWHLRCGVFSFLIVFHICFRTCCSDLFFQLFVTFCVFWWFKVPFWWFKAPFCQKLLLSDLFSDMSSHFVFVVSAYVFQTFCFDICSHLLFVFVAFTRSPGWIRLIYMYIHIPMLNLATYA
jgi:hypothetical protein